MGGGGVRLPAVGEAEPPLWAGQSRAVGVGREEPDVGGEQ